MSLIVVEGVTIDTKDIFDIVDAGWRKHGFIIRMIDKPDVEIWEREIYDSYPHENAAKNDRYRKLRNAVYEKWQADKSEIPTFKL